MHPAGAVCHDRRTDADGLRAPPDGRRASPGPRLPRLIQTLGFLVGGTRFLEACRRRYGDAVTFGTVFDQRFVMVFDPELVKTVFTGSNHQLHAGEANALLGPILGERSVLLLDGDEHLRQRKLMLPAFHGRQMQAHAETMLACADREIDAWPVGEPFTLLGSMQSLTLRIILRAVFGYEPGAEESELRSRLRAMVEPLARPRGMLIVSALMRGRGDRRAALQFEARRRAVDEILFAEIRRRRTAPDLADRDDVFSALLLARDEQGEALSDQEVRDELLTLLLAGHETTATGLAWTFDLLLHDGRVLAATRAGDDAYLDAVCKESLRIRPVIPGVGRVVRASRSGSAATRCRSASRSTRRSGPSTAAARSTPSPRASFPSASSGWVGLRYPTPTPGSRSGAARGAAWARASR